MSKVAAIPVSPVSRALPSTPHTSPGSRVTAVMSTQLLHGCLSQPTVVGVSASVCLSSDRQKSMHCCSRAVLAKVSLSMSSTKWCLPICPNVS